MFDFRNNNRQTRNQLVQKATSTKLDQCMLMRINRCTWSKNVLLD